MPNFFDKYPYTDFHELNLDWIIKTVKETVAEWAVTLTEWHNTQEEWQQLYDYVHDYFDNLDVQQEINNKLDQMALDGSLAAIAQPIIDAKVAQLLPAEVADQIGGTVATQIGSTVAGQLPGVVNSELPSVAAPLITTWLNDHFTNPTSPPIDTSLTVAGAAADAKAAGDAIKAVNNALNTVVSPMFKKAYTKIYADDVMQYQMAYDHDVPAFVVHTQRCIGRFEQLPWGSAVNFDNTKYYATYFIVDKKLNSLYELAYWYQDSTMFIGLGQIKQNYSDNYAVVIQFKKADETAVDASDYSDLLSSLEVYSFNDDYISYLKDNNVQYWDAPFGGILDYRRVVNTSDPSNIIIQTNTARCAGLFQFMPNKSVITFSTTYSLNYYIADEQSKELIYTPNVWDNTGETVINAGTARNINFTVFLQFKKADNTDFSWSDYADLVDSLGIRLMLESSDTINDVDLFMFMGQSNMAGRGTTDAGHPEAAPTIITGAGYEYRAISDPTRLYPIAEPFGRNENNPSGINDGSNKTGSMVTAFANAYYTATGRTVIGVSASKGGTPIADWEPGAASGYMTDALQRLSDAVSYLTSEGYNIKHKFVLWCQGETDMDISTSKASYTASLQNVVDALIGAGIDKFMMVRIGNCNQPGRYNDYKPMIAWQTEICQNNPDIVLADADFAGMAARGLMRDYYHYYQQGYNEVGRYAGTNCAIYADYAKEPTMYDTENDDLYYSHKN